MSGPAHDPATVRHLARLYRDEARRQAFRGQTPSDHAAWREAARPALRELLGLPAIAASLGDFAPCVSLDAVTDCGDHTRQAGRLHAEPDWDVPFWLLRPSSPGPHPLALLPHGHYAAHGLDYAAGLARSEAMREKITRGDRDVGVQAARRGFVAIAPATRGFPPAMLPDLTDRHGGSGCRSQLVHALLAGRTATGERVWDLLQLLDWASSQPTIDTSRVLVMGNSGGGMVTLFTAACDERISVAVASCSFCTAVGAGGLVHHCDCNLVPGLLTFGDYPDIAGLIAPRRLLVVHGREDPLFPPDEVDRAVTATARIFAAAGVPEAFQHEVGAGGHRFYSDLMWPFVEAALSVP